MIEPMLAKLTNPDFHLEGEWISEPKLDGERIIVNCKGEIIRLYTRRDVQVAYKFPEIVEALKGIDCNDWVLDGEITVPGGFVKLLRRNIEDKLKISIMSKKLPATINVFDILKWRGQDLTEHKLKDRKRILLENIRVNEHIKVVPFKSVDDSSIFDHFKEYRSQGNEGAVLKNCNSKYEAGKRTGSWLKIKPSDTVDVNIIGATKSDALPFGALIMEKDGEFYGKVGTGFSDQDRREILELLENNKRTLKISLPESVKDEILLASKPLLAEVRIQEKAEGYQPRAPVWVRFRWNKIK